MNQYDKSLGGLTSSLFNLLHSKKYKANALTATLIYKTGYKKEFKSIYVSEKGELTCIKENLCKLSL